MNTYRVTVCRAEYAEAIAQFQVDMAAESEGTLLDKESVPTLMLFRGGQQLWRQSGALPLENLKCILSNYL